MSKPHSSDTGTDFFLHSPPDTITRELLENPSAGLSIPRSDATSSNVSLLDLYSLDLGKTEGDIRHRVHQLIHACLGMEFLRHGTTSQTVIADLNVLVQEAKAFLSKYLQYSLPREIENIQITTQANILDIFRKASRFRSKKEGHNALGPMYCALLKACYVMHQLHSETYQGFEAQMQYVDRFLRDNGSIRLVRHDSAQDRDYVTTDLWGHPEFYLSGRAKNRFSAAIKMLIKPEIDVNEIIKDPIGFRVEALLRDDLPSLICFLVRLLKPLALQQGFKNVFDIENKGLYTPAIFNDLVRSINDIENACLSIKPGRPNECSATGYQRIHLNMTAFLPKDGQRGMKEARSLEFQFGVSDAHSSDDEVAFYDFKKILSGRTRMTGFLSPEDIAELLSLVGQNTDLAHSENAHHLYRHLVALHDGRYMSVDHARRLTDTSLLPPVEFCDASPPSKKELKRLAALAGRKR